MPPFARIRGKSRDRITLCWEDLDVCSPEEIASRLRIVFLREKVAILRGEVLIIKILANLTRKIGLKSRKRTSSSDFFCCFCLLFFIGGETEANSEVFSWRGKGERAWRVERNDSEDPNRTPTLCWKCAGLKPVTTVTTSDSDNPCPYTQ